MFKWLSKKYNLIPTPWEPLPRRLARLNLDRMNQVFHENHFFGVMCFFHFVAITDLRFFVVGCKWIKCGGILGKSSYSTLHNVHQKTTPKVPICFQSVQDQLHDLPNTLPVPGRRHNLSTVLVATKVTKLGNVRTLAGEVCGIFQKAKTAEISPSKSW